MVNRMYLVKKLNDAIFERFISRHPTFKLDKSRDNFISHISIDDRFIFQRNSLRLNKLFITYADIWVKQSNNYDYFVLEIIGDILLKNNILIISFNYVLDSFDHNQRIDWQYNTFKNKWEILKQF